MKKRILVIGASGVVGQAAIQAVREVYGRWAYIVGTSTSYKPIPGANLISLVTLTSKNIDQGNWFNELYINGPYDITFFTPAYASGIGKPANEVTEEEETEAYNYCVKPLMQLENAGGFGTVVSFSGFLDLPLVTKVYGAMVHAKKQQEHFCAQDILRRQLFRFGAFESKLLRGLAAKILLNWRGQVQQMCKELFSKASGPEQKKLSQVLLIEILEQEKKYFGSTEPTTPEKIRDIIAKWLWKPTLGFYNMVGDKAWLGRNYLSLQKDVLSLEQKQLVELHRCFMPSSL